VAFEAHEIHYHAARKEISAAYCLVSCSEYGHSMIIRCQTMFRQQVTTDFFTNRPSYQGRHHSVERGPHHRAGGSFGGARRRWGATQRQAFRAQPRAKTDQCLTWVLNSRSADHCGAETATASGSRVSPANRNWINRKGEVASQVLLAANVGLAGFALRRERIEFWTLGPARVSR
jgi:hypothetical protein